MTDETLFDQVRDMLLLPGGTSPAEVLEAAHARREFLERQRKEGKKVQRDGAERKLAELVPHLPHLEVVCELLELEAHAAGQRGPLRKHELRLRGTKLKARLESMAEDDARALRTARLADFLETIEGPDEEELEKIRRALEDAEQRASRATAGEIPVVAGDLAALRERIERLPEAKRRDFLARHAQIAAGLARRREAIERETLVHALEACAAKFGGASAAELETLGAELEALRPRIDAVADDAARGALQAKRGALVAALAQRRAQIEIAAVEAALDACGGKIGSAAAAQLEPLRTELEALRPRIDAVPDAEARTALQGKLRDALGALALRRERSDAAAIEAALKACAEKISVAIPPQIEPLRRELETLRERIERISETAGRAALHAAREQALAALEARRKTLEDVAIFSAAEACIAKASKASGDAIAAVVTELQDFAARVAKLPATPARAELEPKLRQALQSCAERGEIFAIESELRALEKATRTPGATDDFTAWRNKLSERIEKLPAGDIRTGLARELDRIMPEPTVPQSRRRSVQPGEVLRLRPVMVKGSMRPLPPVVFVARSRFVLGRFPTRADAQVKADFSCPTSMTKISREHVILQRNGREILAQDPGTVNGSWIGEQRLEATPAAVKFAPAQEIVLGFGPILTVIAQHLAAAAPEGPPIVQREVESFRPPAPPSLLTGAVRFAPKPAMELPVLVTWIFTDAALGSAAGNAIVFPPDFPAQIGRVHYWDGAFWFENTAGTTPVFFLPGAENPGERATPPAERPLAPGEVVDLAAGDTLRFGAATYAVEIEF